MKKTGKIIVKIDPRYFRPAEVELLIGDSKKAKDSLGWKPKVTFLDLVQLMTQSDEEAVRHEVAKSKVNESLKVV